MRPLCLVLTLTLIVSLASPAWSQNLNPTGDVQRRARSALDEWTAFDFNEIPLNVALRLVAEAHEIPIILDHQALNELGLASDTPVTIHLKRISLRNALRLVLNDLGLQFMIRDDILEVTSIETNCGAPQLVEIYSLPKELAKRSGKVIEMIYRMIHTDAWEPYGGASRVDSIDHVLIVYTTPEIQGRVRSFLAQLIEKHSQSSPSGP